MALDLRTLDFLPVVSDEEIYSFIRRYRPQGIGWVDAGLLVSCLQVGASLWTNDLALRALAATHGRSPPEDDA